MQRDLRAGRGQHDAVHHRGDQRLLIGRKYPKAAAGFRAAAFTLIELLVVMVIIAILVAVAAPRFFVRSDYEGPAFAQELAGAARYAQKLAVATGCPVRFHLLDASHYELTQAQNAPAPSCGTDFNRSVKHPATGGNFAGTAPDGVAIPGPFDSTSRVEFDSRGVPNQGLSRIIAGKTLVITAGSGYVELQ